MAWRPRTSPPAGVACRVRRAQGRDERAPRIARCRAAKLNGEKFVRLATWRSRCRADPLLVFGVVRLVFVAGLDPMLLVGEECLDRIDFAVSVRAVAGEQLGDRLELFQRGRQVLDDLLRDDLRRGQA